MFEDDAVVRKRVDRRRLDGAIAVRGQVIGAQRVDGNQDDGAGNGRGGTGVMPAAESRQSRTQRGDCQDERVAKRTGHNLFYLSWSITVLACAASADVGSTATTRCIRVAAFARSPRCIADMPSFRSGLPQFGSRRRRLLVPRQCFVGLPASRFDLAEVVEHFLAGALRLRRRAQRALGGRQVAFVDVGERQADARLVARRVGFQQIVVHGDRVVVVLLVAVRGADLQLEHGERGRALRMFLYVAIA